MHNYHLNYNVSISPFWHLDIKKTTSNIQDSTDCGWSGIQGHRNYVRFVQCGMSGFGVPNLLIKAFQCFFLFPSSLEPPNPPLPILLSPLFLMSHGDTLGSVLELHLVSLCELNFISLWDLDMCIVGLEMNSGPFWTIIKALAFKKIKAYIHLLAKLK